MPYSCQNVQLTEVANFQKQLWFPESIQEKRQRQREISIQRTDHIMNFPGCPVVENLPFNQGAEVQSPIRELRSHKLWR